MTMEYEMETEVEIRLKVKIKFTPVKAIPDRISEWDGGEPGHPAHIEDLEVVSIITDRIKTPLEYKDGQLVREEKEMPLNITGKPSLDNDISFAIMSTKTDEEWNEECLEYVNEI